MEMYTIVRVLGEGSFGSAVLATNKYTQEQIVLKRISLKKLSGKIVEDAKKEVQVLSSFCHPFITKFVHSFEYNGELFIGMEYCSGGDLKSVLRQRSGILLPQDRILAWFVQLCLAVKHIHDRNILHRDVKAQNIFLTKEGRIKLGDFGISKELENSKELANTCIGTPYYLSPEMCQNKPYNSKSDVWALGCVLYEMATLKHPFEANCMKTLLLNILKGTVKPIPSRYSWDFKTLIKAILKTDPILRPSVTEILAKQILFKRLPKFVCEIDGGDDILQQLKKLTINENRNNRSVSGLNITSPAAKYGVNICNGNFSRRVSSNIAKKTVSFKSGVRSARNQSGQKALNVKDCNFRGKMRAGSDLICAQQSVLNNGALLTPYVESVLQDINKGKYCSDLSPYKNGGYLRGTKVFDPTSDLKDKSSKTVSDEDNDTFSCTSAENCRGDEGYQRHPSPIFSNTIKNVHCEPTSLRMSKTMDPSFSFQSKNLNKFLSQVQISFEDENVNQIVLNNTELQINSIKNKFHSTVKDIYSSTPKQSNRQQWGIWYPSYLADAPLETTASAMEATSVGDIVTVHGSTLQNVEASNSFQLPFVPSIENDHRTISKNLVQTVCLTPKTHRRSWSPQRTNSIIKHFKTAKLVDATLDTLRTSAFMADTVLNNSCVCQCNSNCFDVKCEKNEQVFCKCKQHILEEPFQNKSLFCECKNVSYESICNSLMTCEYAETVQDSVENSARISTSNNSERILNETFLISSSINEQSTKTNQGNLACEKGDVRKVKLDNCLPTLPVEQDEKLSNSTIPIEDAEANRYLVNNEYSDLQLTKTSDDNYFYASAQSCFFKEDDSLLSRYNDANSHNPVVLNEGSAISHGSLTECRKTLLESFPSSSSMKESGYSSKAVSENTSAFLNLNPENMICVSTSNTGKSNTTQCPNDQSSFVDKKASNSLAKSCTEAPTKQLPLNMANSSVNINFDLKVHNCSATASLLLDRRKRSRSLSDLSESVQEHLLCDDLVNNMKYLCKVCKDQTHNSEVLVDSAIIGAKRLLSSNDADEVSHLSLPEENVECLCENKVLPTTQGSQHFLNFSCPQLRNGNASDCSLLCNCHKRSPAERRHCALSDLHHHSVENCKDDICDVSLGLVLNELDAEVIERINTLELIECAESSNLCSEINMIPEVDINKWDAPKISSLNKQFSSSVPGYSTSVVQSSPKQFSSKNSTNSYSDITASASKPRILDQLYSCFWLALSPRCTKFEKHFTFLDQTENYLSRNSSLIDVPCAVHSCFNDKIAEDNNSGRAGSFNSNDRVSTENVVACSVDTNAFKAETVSDQPLLINKFIGFRDESCITSLEEISDLNNLAGNELLGEKKGPLNDSINEVAIDSAAYQGTHSANVKGINQERRLTEVGIIPCPQIINVEPNDPQKADKLSLNRLLSASSGNNHASLKEGKESGDQHFHETKNRYIMAVNCTTSRSLMELLSQDGNMLLEDATLRLERGESINLCLSLSYGKSCEKKSRDSPSETGMTCSLFGLAPTKNENTVDSETNQPDDPLSRSLSLDMIEIEIDSDDDDGNESNAFGSPDDTCELTLVDQNSSTEDDIFGWIEAQRVYFEEKMGLEAFTTSFDKTRTLLETASMTDIYQLLRYQASRDHLLLRWLSKFRTIYDGKTDLETSDRCQTTTRIDINNSWNELFNINHDTNEDMVNNALLNEVMNKVLKKFFVDVENVGSNSEMIETYGENELKYFACALVSLVNAETLFWM